MSMGLPPLQGAPIGVVGAGATGRAVTRALFEIGARPIVVDTRSADAAPEGASEELSAVAAELHWGDPEALGRTSLVVISPGVAIGAPFLAPARAAGVEIIGEVELAYRLRPDAILVGITGTNGKSTTTALTGAMLEASGVTCQVCGNIGTPLITHMLSRAEDAVLVVELSSFQLESCSRLRVRSAALLNLSDDHRDRHPTPGEYLAAKSRIFGNQTAGDVAVLGADCRETRRLGDSLDPSRLMWFSALDRAVPGAYCEDGSLVLALPGQGPRAILRVEEMALQGAHNVRNACAAMCLASSRGATPEGMAEALRHFAAARHTFEVVGSAAGAVWVNDSKGTNVDSTLRALESCTGPVILIAGGSEKEADYRPLGPVMAARCKALVTLGETGPSIAAVGREAGLEEIHAAESMPEAVRIAASFACPGDWVLLSPASASFGLFRNYAHRGQCFVEAVHELEGFTPAGSGGV